MANLDFVVTQLLNPRGPRFLNLATYGRAEIRPPRLDTPAEAAAVVESCAAFAVTSPEKCMRIATVASAETNWEAERRARLQFEEVLDVIAHRSPLSRSALLQPGFIRDLRGGNLQPLRPRDLQGMTFHVGDEHFPPLDVERQLLLDGRTDLAESIVRAKHWLRVADNDDSDFRKLVFKWFALEAVWKQQPDDCILGRVLWGLGFASGGTQNLSAGLAARLNSHPRYRVWTTQVRTQLEKIRGLRNDAVHSGFREHDVPAAELAGHESLLLMAAPRTIDFAITAMRLGATTQAELIEYIPVVFEANPVLVDDVHGTVIYNLEGGARRGQAPP